MEHLLRCTQPALIAASDRLIDLVDQVIERYPNPQKKSQPRRKLFSWHRRREQNLLRDLGRPSLDRPSQKI